MKIIAPALVAVACFWTPDTVDAQQGLPRTCPPRPTKVVTGPTGKTIVACLDGKYSTCLRDSQRAGWPYAEAKRFCDNNPRLRRDL